MGFPKQAHTHIQQKCNRNCFGSQNVNLISAFVTLVLKFNGISQRKWIETMKRIHFLIEKYLIHFFLFGNRCVAHTKKAPC